IRTGVNARAGQATALSGVSVSVDSVTQHESTVTYEPESAFFGFDFGSTNSAISYISKRSVQITKARGTDYQWGSLRDNIENLPIPVAHAAALYLSPRDTHEQSLNALSLFEASYAFLAYLTYSESRNTGRRQTHLLK